MKIVGIISSPNKYGNTATLVRTALKAAEEEGLKTEEIFLDEYNIKYCRGCLSCMSTGKCIISDDDFKKLYNIILNADGVILGSPNYGYSMNAIMRTFLERYGLFEFMTSNSFGGKYVAGIAASGGKKGVIKVAKSTIKMVKSAMFKRGFVSGYLGVATRGEHIKNNKKILDKAMKLGLKIAMDIKGKQKYKYQNISGRFMKKILIKPMFKKVILKNKERNMKAIYENLKERGLIEA